MIQNFTNLSSVKFKVRVCEMNECNTEYKDKHPGIVCLTLRFKRIIAKFVAIWRIVDIMFLFKGMTVRIR